MPQPEVADWPRGELEAVSRCPICGGGRRETLYSDLTDRVFFTAPGRWTLHRCPDCASVYLDPRPTSESIGLAYGSYYTHESDAPPPSLVAEGARLAIRNGYLNARYGYDLHPASRLGPVVSALLPKRRALVDHLVRHLKHDPGRNRLLDVGCGNGAFLAGMRDAGWSVQGLEPDATAAEQARSGGIPVAIATFEDAPFEDGSFDAITLNHVVEHFHDPVAALRICRRLLAPGGTLWISTPNLQSRGHTVFGPDWIGLDPPRHLVLFTRSSLTSAVERAGFAASSFPRIYTAAQTFALSESVVEGVDPFGSGPEHSVRGRVLTADLLTRLNPASSEEIILIAKAS